MVGPLLIGIGHQKGVGKDYLAKKLKKRLQKMNADLNVVIVPFARAMKEYAHQLFGALGMESPDYYDENPEEKDEPLPFADYRTPRDLMIAFANAVRSIHEDVWLDTFDAVVSAYDADVVIVPDVRFENEVEALVCSYDSILVKMFNPDIPVDEDGADDQLIDFDGWDYQILNDFEPKTIKKHVKIFANHIIERFENAQ